MTDKLRQMRQLEHALRAPRERHLVELRLPGLTDADVTAVVDQVRESWLNLSSFDPRARVLRERSHRVSVSGDGVNRIYTVNQTRLQVSLDSEEHTLAYTRGDIAVA